MGKIFQLKLKLFFLPFVFSLQDFIHAHVFFKCVYIFISIKFIYLFMAVLGLHRCTQAFSSCGEQEATI